MKVQVIPEWKLAWRMLSQRFALLAVAWLSLSDDAQARVLSMLWPSATVEQVAGALVIAGMVGRMIVQPKLRGETHE